MGKIFRSNGFLFICIATAFAVLCSLGNWQVNRLAWKEDLIARVDTQLAQDPLSITKAVEEMATGRLTPNYVPVILRGEFAAIDPVFEFTTFSGQSGWHVFYLFQPVPEDQILGAKYLVVNRGFIPFELRKDDKVPTPPEGQVALKGLTRAGLKEKPGYFVLDNEPELRTFHWRDISTMVETFGIEGNLVSPIYVDLGLPSELEAQRALPLPGTTRVVFSNNHFGYAVTWYGLAFSLVCVGGWFMWTRRKKSVAV